MAETLEEDFAAAGLPRNAPGVQDMDTLGEPEVFSDFDYIDDRCQGIEDIILTGEVLIAVFIVLLF